MGNVKSNPSNDSFPTIDVDGFGEEQEKAKMKPLPEARYLFEIEDYDVFLTGEMSKSGAGVPYVRFRCRTIDSDPDLNGRLVSTGPLMLSGAGFRFFVGDGRKGGSGGFVEIIKPNRKWDVKKGIRLLEDGYKEDGGAGSVYLDSFTGCQFSAEVSIDLDDEGEATGFNSMVRGTMMSP